MCVGGGESGWGEVCEEKSREEKRVERQAVEADGQIVVLSSL